MKIGKWCIFHFFFAKLIFLQLNKNLFKHKNKNEFFKIKPKLINRKSSRSLNID